jgi:hypothetical protein
VKLRRKRLFTLLVLEGYKQESAEEILASGRRYAVYLRGFKYENSSMGEFGISEGLGEETESLGIRIRPAHIEVLISKILNQDISLISLPDPQTPLPIAGAHRFLNPPADWETFIKNLLAKADPIFLYITSFTPGIVTELKMLTENKWLHKTILIVGRGIPLHEILSNKILSQAQLYKNIIYETGARQWTRKHEKTLKKNLTQRLANYEQRTDQKGNIVNGAIKKIPLIMPSRWYIAFKFFIASLFWFTTALMFSSMVIYPEAKSWDQPIADLGIMFVFYFFVRVFEGMDRQDPSHQFTLDDKHKTKWNNEMSI